MGLLVHLLAIVPCVQAPQRSPLLEPDGDSGSPSISDDGKLVVFESRASNFVAGDQKDSWDVFLFERDSGAVTRISDDEPRAARVPQISGDGRWIAYLQAQRGHAFVYAGDVSPGTEHPWQVVLFDREKRSRHSIGDARPTHEIQQRPKPLSISRDGSQLVFSSLSGGLEVISHYDATSKRLEIVVPSNDGSMPTVDVVQPRISSSGRFLVFATAAKTLASPPRESSIYESSAWLAHSFFEADRNIFRRDLGTGLTEDVSHLANEVLNPETYGDFSNPFVSGDGRFVAYDQHPTNAEYMKHVGFVSDTVEDRAGRLLPVREAKGDNWWQGKVSIEWLSASGRQVLVRTYSECVPAVPETCAIDQLVLRDLDSSSWSLVSKSADGRPANRAADDGVAANDLSLFAYASEATNLVSDDRNGHADVFLFEPSTAKTTRIVPMVVLPPDTPGKVLDVNQPNADSTGASLSEDGEFAVFASRASNFDAQDSADSWDVFLLMVGNGAVRRLSVEEHQMVSRPAISGDGRWVFWWSLPPEATWHFNPWTLRVVERATGRETVVPGLEPDQAGHEPGLAPSISRDGNRVVFLTVTPVEVGNWPSVAKLFDRTLGTASLIHMDRQAGIDASITSHAISGDGQIVAGASEQSCSVTLSTGATLRAKPVQSSVPTGTPALAKLLHGWASAHDPFLSKDGRRVAFNWYGGREATPPSLWGMVCDFEGEPSGRLLPLVRAPERFQGSLQITWLAPDGMSLLASTNAEGVLEKPVAEFAQAFLHHLDSGEWIPISRSAAGEFANRPCEAAVSSRDLSRIVFESEADNLVPGDTNEARDLFIVDRKMGRISRVEANR